MIFMIARFFFYCYADLRDLHSFPTRRSSDLVSRAWNGCCVKWNGNTEFRSRSACSLDAPQMNPLQSLGGKPALARMVLLSWHSLYWLAYDACALKMRGSTFVNCCVNPAQPAETDSVGP